MSAEWWSLVISVAAMLVSAGNVAYTIRRNRTEAARRARGGSTIRRGGWKPPPDPREGHR